MKTVRWLGTAGIIGVLAACGSSLSSKSAPAQPPPNLGATVVLRDIAFNPGAVTVRTGQSVLWRWNDGSVPHNVAADTFQSVTQEHGTFSHTFSAPGKYQYRCTIHSAMTGTVVVNP